MSAPTIDQSRTLLAPLTDHTLGPWYCSRTDIASYDMETGRQVSFLYPGEGGRVCFETDNPVEDARLAAAAPDLAAHLAARIDGEVAALARAEQHYENWQVSLCETRQAEAERDAARAEAERLREALAWYGEQARLCRLIHSEGDAGRHALSGDGGKRARAVLAKDATQ